MSIQTLNGPLEVGLRLLSILNSAFPQKFDLAALAMMDHSLLHTAEFGGPASLHPRVPGFQGEQAVKRELIEHGLQVMIRAGLIEVSITVDGFLYGASERAHAFLQLLDAQYVHELKLRARWVVGRHGADGETMP